MTAWSNRARTRSLRKRHARKSRRRPAPQMRTTRRTLSYAKNLSPRTETRGVFAWLFGSVSVKLRHYRLFTALCTETYLGFPKTRPHDFARRMHSLLHGLLHRL